MTRGSSASATTRCVGFTPSVSSTSSSPPTTGSAALSKVTRRMIWWFYRQLKAFKLAPGPERAAELRARFDRIFKRRTGYATLDKLLKRLHANKGELLRVLERPEIPPTPTHPKTTFAPSSPSAKSQAERSATTDASPATSCSASPRHAPNSKSHSSTISAPASKSRDRKSRPSQPWSRPIQFNHPAREFAPVTKTRCLNVLKGLSCCQNLAPGRSL